MWKWAGPLAARAVMGSMRFGGSTVGYGPVTRDIVSKLVAHETR